jgi:hypothetical protein
MQVLFNQHDDAVYRCGLVRNAGHADMLTGRIPSCFAESGIFAAR